MKVLAARLDSLGDVLVCGPAVRAIADGAANVAMLCGPAGAAAGRILPGVDRVITWEAPWIASPAPPITAASVRELIAQIREFGPDAAVIFTSFHQSPLPLAMILRLAGVPHITGASVDHAGALLDVRLIPGEDFPEDQPEVVRALQIAAAAGFLPPSDDRLRVDVHGEPGSGVEAPYVVVHPGADAPARQWPPEHYRLLVPELLQQGYGVLVTGSAHEMPLTAYVAGNEGTDLGGSTTLADLAHTIAGAEAIVTGNTGPAHLAAAVGTPVVSLFSPVVPKIRWAPWGVPTVVLGDEDAPCRNTRARVCPVPGHPCLTSVTPTDVAAAVQQLTASRRTPQKEGVGR